MSEVNKNRLEVQKIIRDVILLGIEKMNLGDWDVMEFANASFQKADKIVLMNLLRTSRVGWQSHYYATIDEQFSRVESYTEEQTWQIHSICKRTDNTTVDDVLAEDIASRLITWFNGPGIDELRKRYVAPLRVDTDSILVYTDNSDFYQKRAVFTVKIQVPKELAFGEFEAEAIMPKIMPI